MLGSLYLYLLKQRLNINEYDSKLLLEYIRQANLNSH